MSKYCFLGRVLRVPAPVLFLFAIKDDKAEPTSETSREILVKILEHLDQKNHERVTYHLVLCYKRGKG